MCRSFLSYTLIFHTAFIALFPIQASAASSNEIAQLLRQCERHFQANRLTRGKSGRAFDCYKKVLEKDADNAQALAGLKKIEARYIGWAQKALKIKRINKVKQYLEGLRKVNPTSPTLAKLEAQIFPNRPSSVLKKPQTSSSSEKPSKIDSSQDTDSQAPHSKRQSLAAKGDRQGKAFQSGEERHSNSQGAESKTQMSTTSGKSALETASLSKKLYQNRSNEKADSQVADNDAPVLKKPQILKEKDLGSKVNLNSAQSNSEQLAISEDSKKPDSQIPAPSDNSSQSQITSIDEQANEPTIPKMSQILEEIDLESKVNPNLENLEQLPKELVEKGISDVLKKLDSQIPVPSDTSEESEIASIDEQASSQVAANEPAIPKMSQILEEIEIDLESKVNPNLENLEQLPKELVEKGISEALKKPDSQIADPSDTSEESEIASIDEQASFQVAANEPAIPKMSQILEEIEIDLESKVNPNLENLEQLPKELVEKGISDVLKKLDSQIAAPSDTSEESEIASIDEQASPQAAANEPVIPKIPQILEEIDLETKVNPNLENLEQLPKELVEKGISDVLKKPDSQRADPSDTSEESEIASIDEQASFQVAANEPAIPKMSQILEEIEIDLESKVNPNLENLEQLPKELVEKGISDVLKKLDSQIAAPSDTSEESEIASIDEQASSQVAANEPAIPKIPQILEEIEIDLETKVNPNLENLEQLPKELVEKGISEALKNPDSQIAAPSDTSEESEITSIDEQASSQVAANEPAIPKIPQILEEIEIDLETKVNPNLENLEQLPKELVEKGISEALMKPDSQIVVPSDTSEESEITSIDEQASSQVAANQPVIPKKPHILEEIDLESQVNLNSDNSNSEQMAKLEIPFSVTSHVSKKRDSQSPDPSDTSEESEIASIDEQSSSKVAANEPSVSKQTQILEEKDLESQVNPNSVKSNSEQLVKLEKPFSKISDVLNKPDSQRPAASDSSKESQVVSSGEEVDSQMAGYEPPVLKKAKIRDVGQIYEKINNTDCLNWPSSKMKKKGGINGWESFYPKKGDVGIVIKEMPHCHFQTNVLILQMTQYYVPISSVGVQIIAEEATSEK
jgi:hypothetical protein